MTAILLAAVFSAAATAPQPTLVRVAVVDDSPSMSGERIAAVRKDLMANLKQMPPSPQFPWVLIVFHGTVEPAQVFTDRSGAERAIAALHGDGTGTHIAPALTKAYQVLQPYKKSSDVLVLLFTDGEDADQQGILRAESQLDALFAERDRQGLSQTVFVKRWGNANAQLINKLREHGHAQVLDAGDLAITSVAVDPTVIIHGIRRDPKDLRRIQIVYSPSLNVRGSLPHDSSAVAIFDCRNAGASGQTTIQVATGDSRARYLLTLPATSQAEKLGRIDLSFHVKPHRGRSSHNQYVLPLLTATTIVVPIPLPQLAINHRASAEIRKMLAVSWENPLEQRVRCKLDVVLTITSVQPANGVDRSTTFKIAVGRSAKLIADVDTISVAGPGTYDIPLMVDVPLDTATEKQASKTAGIELELRPIRKCPFLSYTPSVVQARHDGVAAPSKVETVITPVVTRVGRPVWVDLARSLVAFDAEVKCRVAGPIPHRTTVTLVSPSEVRNNVLPPDTRLVSGETSVTLRVVAQLNKPNQVQPLRFEILPPPPTAAVTFRVAHGFVLPVTPPPPATIINMDTTGPRPVIQTNILDYQDSFDVLLTPAFAGVEPSRVGSLPNIRTTTRGSVAESLTELAAANSRRQLHVRLRAATTRPFFTDTRYLVTFDLQPETPSAAIVPGRVDVVVLSQAPFKRLLCYLAWAIFPIGILSLLFRTIRNLREPVALRGVPCST